MPLALAELTTKATIIEVPLAFKVIDPLPSELTEYVPEYVKLWGVPAETSVAEPLMLPWPSKIIVPRLTSAFEF